MLDGNRIDKEVYNQLMHEIKELNSDYYSLRKGKEFIIGKAVNMSLEVLKTGKVSQFIKQYNNWKKGHSLKNVPGTPMAFEYPNRVPNYFSSERIAVYTVIFGKYDMINEPLCHPDNIDYYIVTDQSLDLKKSNYKLVDISSFSTCLKDLSNAEKNRFFKMHPYLIFPNYNYSIYVDGNIQIITDLTEYIHYIEESGISIHSHYGRDCVFDECIAIIKSKKETKENINKHVEHLKNEGMPRHYGLLECNVIARKHNEMCKTIMEEWWKEFMQYSKRDQISLPYVLYKHHIDVKDIATMGENVYKNPSFRIITHS